jgi:hypothetical protein
VASGKYLCGRGDKYRPVWLPPVPDVIRRKVSQHYDSAVPTAKDCPDFLAWWAINGAGCAITEGPHKAASALSAGIPMLAASGVDALVHGAKSGERQGELRDEVRSLIEGQQRVICCFDRDGSGQASRRVGFAINRIRRAVRDLAGGRKTEFLIADWNPSEGKGIDDVRRAQGLTRVIEILRSASPWESVVSRRFIKGRLGRTPDKVIQLKPGESAKDYAGEIAQAALGRKLLGIKGVKGAGKSELLAELSANRSFLALYHRVSLARAMAIAAESLYRTDIDSALGRSILEKGSRVTACLDGAIGSGASGVPLDFLRGDGVLGLDELEQLFFHVLEAGTLGDRATQARDYLGAAVKTSGLTIAASADLTGWSLDLLESLAADAAGRERAFLVQILGWRESWPGSVAWVTGNTGTPKALAASLAAIDRGERIVFCTDSKKAATENFEALKIRVGGDWEIGQVPGLLVTADTAGDPDVAAFQANPDAWLAEHPEFRFLVHSPSIASGVSIKSESFDRVIGLSVGAVTPEEFAQMLDRFRLPVQREIFTVKRGLYRGKFSGSWNVDDCLEDQQRGGLAASAAAGATDVYRARGALEDANPWNKAQAAVDAEKNLKSALHGYYLIELLKHEGKKIELVSEVGKLTDEDKELLEKIKAEIAEKRFQAINSANKIDEQTAKAYSRLESLTNEQRFELERYNIETCYQIDLAELSEDEARGWVEWDNRGRRRAAAAAFHQFQCPDAAKESDGRAIDRAIKTPSRLTTREIPKSQLRAKLREQLGLDDLLLGLGEFHNQHPVIERIAATARANQNELRIALGVSIGAGHSNTQIVSSLLNQLGIAVEFVRQIGSGATVADCDKHGVEPVRGVRIYEINRESVERMRGIAQRREQHRLDVLAANRAAADSLMEPGEDAMIDEVIEAFTPDVLAEVLRSRYGVSSIAETTPEQITDLWRWWRQR